MNSIKNKRELKPYLRRLSKINLRRSQLETLSDYHLKDISENLKKSARRGISLDNLLEEAFALVCETSRRVLQLRPFDVQVLTGAALHDGNLAEMQTGEGKTLAAVFPVYLNALTGQGVHVLTFNDYLARRDAGWMGPIYRFLGLSVAYVQEGFTAPARKKAYAADITYLTAREAGFDFLRDQRCTRKEDLVQRPFQFVIVDEADSILIDEARVPLVIAGEISSASFDPYRLAEVVRQLEKNNDFSTDEYAYDVNLTEKGIDRVETSLGCGNLYDPENNTLFSAVNLALQAEVLLKRDIDYIVRGGRIELVDEFTGRVAENRRWPYGLQTAIEAKEGVEIQPEGTILGSITLQHFLGLYPKIAGMTATARTSSDEMKDFYNLKVVTIPPNRPCIRIDHEDVVFTHKEAKRKALLREITRVHAAGRPILVGTASVEESEQLAGEIRKAGVQCQVLNAKNDEAEAAIVAEAGAINAVTISTNMAGRGTDIKLGGNDQKDHAAVAALGGLYVIGTNRCESRRIDLQLRGRAGRQGDPGSSRFFISLEDDLIQRYRVKELIPAKHLPPKQDDPIESPVVAGEIARAQRIIEGQNYEIRKNLRKYSFLIEEQRKILQQQRRDILLGNESSIGTAALASERYRQLAVIWGEEELKQAEKQVRLFHIDQCWAEHLESIAHIKEGIHLWGISGGDPLPEFGKRAIEAFDHMQQQIEQRTMATLEALAISGKGIDPGKEGPLGPSSTWTYLVSDSLFENPLRRVIAGNRALALGVAIAALPVWPVFIIERLIRFFRRPRFSKNLR